MVDPSPPSPAADKAKLRKATRIARREHVESLPASLRALMFSRPPRPLVDRIPEGATIGLYYATASEAPTLAYARWLFENGHRLALPWFAERGAAMAFREWDNPFVDDLLEPGPYGALQPAADAPALEPEVLFVPLLGFTETCARLGQGGGHYDRWLAAHPDARTYGLAWDCQRLESLPVERHDRALDAVVTPTRFFEGEQS
ncbi:5-formyltetrahydrofolate cyclo-ligase [Novosphingobium sp. PC22D]|uniref:5-formyltetrahydrofolate cyclo-ligase n=1 Tax=Novosphingobium sp. PC22D TaxID=1962403 RepID=UPI000BF03699|nr:5-formyltetrahydrofolate cyclo-ligase [Novosphingobium sp. PC22D]PEQ11804.1 5-formyltetrahydrofolate cyclo-ligase [Novosphingobium sp. PC22D]